jgi:hypothetical protein
MAIYPPFVASQSRHAANGTPPARRCRDPRIEEMVRTIAIDPRTDSVGLTSQTGFVDEYDKVIAARGS